MWRRRCRERFGRYEERGNERVVETGRAELFLYWLSQGINPLSLVQYHEDEAAEGERVPADLARDCMVANVVFPTLNDARATLQQLLDQGKLVAWRESEGLFRGPHELRNVQKANLWDQFLQKDAAPDLTTFELTDEGLRGADAFEDFLYSLEGRKRSMEFALRLFQEETAGLNFKAMLPQYIPEELDPLPETTVFLESDTVTIRYSGPGIDQVFIDQTKQDIGEDDGGDFQSETTREERIGQMLLSVRERQISRSWVELSVSWDTGPIAYRVSYHRSTSAVPDLDEEQFTRPDDQLTDIMITDDTSDQAEEPLEPAVIDEQMREETRKIVASMISQAQSTK